jgi:hypothetical protein
MSLCHRELQRVYRQYNQRWFYGALPEDVDCMFSPAADCYGLVRQEDSGWILMLDPKYAIDGRLWRFTLLHEQNHLYLNPYRLHGIRFQDGMKRLANEGAFRLLW